MGDVLHDGADALVAAAPCQQQQNHKQQQQQSSEAATSSHLSVDQHIMDSAPSARGGRDQGQHLCQQQPPAKRRHTQQHQQLEPLVTAAAGAFLELLNARDEATAASPTVQQLQAAAARQLTSQLGDLEAVWGDDDAGSKQQSLLALPFAALAALLSDAGTRVASENTVLLTIERWCGHWQQARRAPPSDEELSALVSLVRMQQCTPAYVGTIFAAGQVARRALSLPELAQAAAMAGCSSSCARGGGGAPAPAAQQPQQLWPVLQVRPAWAAPARPLTARSEVLTRRLSTDDLFAAYCCAADGGSSSLELGGSSTYAGLTFGLIMSVECQQRASGAGGSSSSGGGGKGGGVLHMRAGMRVSVLGLPDGAACQLSHQLMAETPQRGHWACFHAGTTVFSAAHPHSCRSVDLGPISGWQSFQQGLVAQGLALEEDGSMHVSLELCNRLTL